MVRKKTKRKKKQKKLDTIPRYITLKDIYTFVYNNIMKHWSFFFFRNSKCPHLLNEASDC